MKKITWNTLTEPKRNTYLKRAVNNNPRNHNAVKDIIDNVRERGDAAIKEYSQKFDHVALENIKVSQQEIEEALLCTTNSELNSIKIAIARIENYQIEARPKMITIDTQDGIKCERLPIAIDRIGLYVPGGTAPLVSTVIMLAIPAKVAGCTQRILCTPPMSNGKVNSSIVATAKLCGIDTIYKVGGAQAIAAMAYGTESISKVNKIFGPGNSWVTLAKQMVALDPEGSAIDMPAGPSEVMIIADETANPEFVAADLLAQAEHSTDSQSILITNSEKLAQEVSDFVESQTAKLSRKTIITAALENSCIIIVENIDEAFFIVNQYSPEHLILQLKNAEHYIKKVRNAGAIFIGTWTAETMGDYINGANHVLPTNGFANRMSGLSVADFMKYISVQTVSEQGLLRFGPTAITLAQLEGLDAHGAAIHVRLNCLGESNV